MSQQLEFTLWPSFPTTTTPPRAPAVMHKLCLHQHHSSTCENCCFAQVQKLTRQQGWKYKCLEIHTWLMHFLLAPTETSKFPGFCYFTPMPYPAKALGVVNYSAQNIYFLLSTFFTVLKHVHAYVGLGIGIVPCSCSLNLCVKSMRRSSTSAYAGYLMTYSNSCSAVAECCTPQQVKQSKPASLSPHP